MAVKTTANRARIIAWSRVRDDVGLTNQVCALKTGSGIQKSRRAVRFPFQSTFNPFSHKKFTRSPSKLSFGTGSTRLRLLRGNGTSHAHNHDLCKGGAQDAAQMQPRERMQLHQPTHGTLLTHTSPPRPFFGFFFFK